MTMRYRRYGGVVLAFVTVVAGCTTARVVESPTRPLSEYTLKDTQGGVVIAMDPVLEPARLREYFVKDILRDFSILPLFIVMQNEQAAPLLVQNGRFALLDGSGVPLVEDAPIAATARLESVKHQMDNDLTLGMLLGYMFLGPAGVFITAGVAATISPGDYKDAAENIFKRALFDRVLHKGASHRGFIYFRCAPRERCGETRALRVTVRNVTTDQDVVLRVGLDLSKGEPLNERTGDGK